MATLIFAPHPCPFRFIILGVLGIKVIKGSFRGKYISERAEVTPGHYFMVLAYPGRVSDFYGAKGHQKLPQKIANYKRNFY